LGIFKCPPENYKIGRDRYEGLRQNRSLYSFAIELAIANEENAKAIELIDKVAAFDEANANYWKSKKDGLKA